LLPHWLYHTEADRWIVAAGILPAKMVEAG
jgi:hypothetical protein